MKKSGAFPLSSPYFRSIWFENKVSWCALKSSFERKWLVNVCCKNDDEMRWILLAFQDWKQKTYETIMCLFDLASLFCNIWKYYKKGMPFIRDVITIILKLLVILCPGGKLIKWNDMKILRMMTWCAVSNDLMKTDPWLFHYSISNIREFLDDWFRSEDQKMIHSKTDVEAV